MSIEDRDYSIQSNSWKWDFGDRTQVSGNIIDHTYTNPGTYTVLLHYTRVKNRFLLYVYPLKLPFCTALGWYIPVLLK